MRRSSSAASTPTGPASRLVMAALRELSPLVEPLSLDEAFVDLAASARTSSTCPPTVSTAIAAELKQACRRGDRRPHRVGRDRDVEADRQDRQRARQAGRRRSSSRPAPSGTCCAPMQVTVIPGVGPATAERLRQDRRQHRRGARSDQPRGAGAGGRPGPRVRACTPWPEPTTTVPWSPSARPSRCRSRTRSTPTSSTRCCSPRSSTGTRAASCERLSQGAAVRSHGHAEGAACTTSPRTPGRRPWPARPTGPRW